jgi:hypothetical protein
MMHFMGGHMPTIRINLNRDVFKLLAISAVVECRSLAGQAEFLLKQTLRNQPVGEHKAESEPPLYYEEVPCALE